MGICGFCLQTFEECCFNVCLTRFTILRNKGLDIVGLGNIYANIGGNFPSKGGLNVGDGWDYLRGKL